MWLASTLQLSAALMRADKDFRTPHHGFKTAVWKTCMEAGAGWILKASFGWAEPCGNERIPARLSPVELHGTLAAIATPAIACSPTDRDGSSPRAVPSMKRFRFRGMARPVRCVDAIGIRF